LFLIVAACVGSAGSEVASTKQLLANELGGCLDIEHPSIFSDTDCILPATG
jgi:hypothetical protein